MKFIKIHSKKNNEDFIDYCNIEENTFILEYAFPIVKDIFRMIIKEYKKVGYKQRLIDCNDADEGCMLEHLVYLSFDKDEKQFSDQLKIDYHMKWINYLNARNYILIHWILIKIIKK